MHLAASSASSGAGKWLAGVGVVAFLALSGFFGCRRLAPVD